MILRLFSRVPRTQSLLGGVAVATVCAAGGILLRNAIGAAWPESSPTVVLFPLIALAALAGGRPVGLGTLLLMAIAMVAEGLLGGQAPVDGAGLTLFVIAATLIAALGGELRHTLEHAAKLRTRLSRAQDMAGVGDWSWSSDGSTLELSRPSWALFGRPAELQPVSTGRLHTMIHPDDVDEFRHLARQTLADRTAMRTEFRAVLPGGASRWLQMRGTFGQHGGLEGVLVDIDERRRAEDDCATSLARQDLLHRELAHRVKNNFQLVASLLRMQARKGPEGLRPLLDRAIQRIQGMGALHDCLYSGGEIGTVNAERYLGDLCARLKQTLIGQHPLRLVTSVEPITLPADRALSLGLAVTELVSNAVRHGFPGQTQGEISVRLARLGDYFTLTVENDGASMDSLGAFRAEGFGMTLVQSCAHQFDGDLMIERQPHTRFSIRFPASSIQLPK